MNLMIHVVAIWWSLKRGTAQMATGGGGNGEKKEKGLRRRETIVSY